MDELSLSLDPESKNGKNAGQHLIYITNEDLEDLSKLFKQIEELNQEIQKVLIVHKIEAKTGPRCDELST